MLGDRERADRAFAAATDALATDVESAERGWRADYGSVLRDASAILTLAVDAKAKPNVIKTAIGAIEVERARTHYASTQEMSWMVLAARAVAGDAKTIRLNVGGDDHAGSYNHVFREADLQQDTRVTNPGASPLRAVVAVSGSPLVGEPASSNGLVIDRKYYTVDGEPTSIASVQQNTRLVAVLTVSAASGGPQNGTFLLVDTLPAGLEIENPALISSGAAGTLSWLTDTTWASHTEFRDDRFVASFTNATAKLAYMVRAVAPGTYAHPGATVEDMYRPQVNARTSPGTMVVTAP
jgi:hypothetical protein